jgi:hypothetical protein
MSEQSEKPQREPQRQRVTDGAHLKIPNIVYVPDDVSGGAHPKVPLPFTPTGEDKPKT